MNKNISRARAQTIKIHRVYAFAYIEAGNFLKPALAVVCVSLGMHIHIYIYILCLCVRQRRRAFVFEFGSVGIFTSVFAVSLRSRSREPLNTRAGHCICIYIPILVYLRTFMYTCKNTRRCKRRDKVSRVGR